MDIAGNSTAFKIKKPLLAFLLLAETNVGTCTIGWGCDSGCPVAKTYYSHNHSYNLPYCFHNYNLFKIMVCGSIGYSGKIDDIGNMCLFLKSKGFSIVNNSVQYEKMNYSGITDFRNKENLSRQIVKHDLRYIRKTDVVVVIGNGPSYGAAIEMFVAKMTGKKVILFARDPIPTPWPINFSDYRVKNEDTLIELLHKLQNN